MADLTEEEEERVEPQPHVKANIEAIAALIAPNSRIAKAEERAQKARGELGNVYQKIQQDYHGNIQAAKLVRRLQAGTTDAAYDFMRTFMPLAGHFGLIPEEDLVDKAEKAEAGTKARAGDNVVRGPGWKTNLDNARSHLSGGTKPETPAEKRQREYGFDPNPPAGDPGDEDLVRAGEEAAKEKAAAE